MHPEDLFNFLTQGNAQLKGSDWKYGWPHKFYVEGIPNLAAGQPVAQYVYCGDPARLQPRPGEENHPIEATETGGYRRKLYDYPAPATVHAKWYNEHLADLDKPAFEALTELIFRKGQILFARGADSRLMYTSPSAGLQA